MNSDAAGGNARGAEQDVSHRREEKNNRDRDARAAQQLLSFGQRTATHHERRITSHDEDVRPSGTQRWEKSALRVR